MFWKKLKSMFDTNPGESEPFVDDEDYFINLKEDQIDAIAAIVMACIPNEVSGQWYFRRFQAMEDEPFLARLEMTQDELMEMHSLEILRYSWMLFPMLDEHDPWDAYRDDNDNIEEDKVLEALTFHNYTNLFTHSAKVRTTLSPFLEAKQQGRNIRWPGGDLVDLIDELNRTQREEDDALISSLIADHKTTLVPEVLRLIAVNTNRYGKTDFLPAKEEIAEFWSSIPGYEDIKTYDADDLLLETLVQIQDSYERRDAGKEVPGGGADFELWCSDQLTKSGIANQLSPSGADQGIDIIADIEGRRIGIQCKRYSVPVGNKAVQEALAGKSFYDLDAVCVIATAGYTKAAQALSKRTGVSLLCEHDLEDIGTLCA